MFKGLAARKFFPIPPTLQSFHSRIPPVIYQIQLVRDYDHRYPIAINQLCYKLLLFITNTCKAWRKIHNASFAFTT
ncbi:hypothetical protein L0U88_17050 [Flavihumibacter sp. RY-1]|uniref:Uncharacterized protein n=1 Tax=Flavihumibacter fluminis TaxID=2909236 RepID=A0ABS9BKY4_9BACT|nr:hypothetical protein [Flavihumibacter fluminis]MCF1716352.1 hypothetical protein [Flavihumibacter fluminis]